MLCDTDAVPNQADITHWADFIEFKALIHADRNYTKADFAGDYHSSTDDSTEDSDSHRDKAAGRWSEALRHCRYRNEFFAAPSYPFEIPCAENDIVLLKSGLTRLQEAYLFLLVCSSLKYIVRREMNKIAREFEKTCLSLFKHCMPSGATVKGNWANPSPGENCYAGTLSKKFEAMAKDLRIRVGTTPDDPQNTGDGGIDLVAWHGMHDQRPGIPIAMGQCSCSTTEWHVKSWEAHCARHAETLPVSSPWWNFYFCPLDLWDGENKWRFEAKVRGAIFVDRYRILRIIQANNQQVPTDVVDDLRRCA